MTIKKILAGVTLMAFASATQADRVAVFDAQAAIMQTKDAAKAFEVLKAKPEIAQLTAQVEGYQEELKTLAKEQETKGMTWSSEQQMEHRKKMEYVQADFQLAAKKLQAENQAVFGKLMQEAQPKLREVLSKLVQTEGIDIVLPMQGVIYVNPKSDITAKVAAELDKVE